MARPIPETGSEEGLAKRRTPDWRIVALVFFIGSAAWLQIQLDHLTLAVWEGSSRAREAAPIAPAPVDTAPLPILAVGPIGITVTDLDRAVAFYSEVLGFEVTARADVAGLEYDRLLDMSGLRMRMAALRLGDEVIQLMEYTRPRGRPYPVDARSNDRWFQHIAIVVSDMDRAYERLRRRGVEQISPQPQTLPEWNIAAGGISAFYFRDPDGNSLEILRFPPDKGDPRWQRTAGTLFLGIDHTAIVVGDTDLSLVFYRDALGLRVAGESENYGPEQERLNAVPGAHLRITALRAPEGPGIELLEYVDPPGGRPVPTDIRANDLFHWHTQLVVGDKAIVDALASEFAVRPPLRAAMVGEPVTFSSGALGFPYGLMVRDPDGHAILLVAR